MITRRFSVRGLEIAHHQWGTPGRSAILFSHGFLDHGQSFAPVAEALSDKYFCVAIDFRGHGNSGWVGDGGYYHFVDYVADARRLVSELGLDEIHLVGHSMGGSVSVALSALLGESVKSMVLLEGMGPPAEDMDSAPDRLRRWVYALDTEGVRGSVGERRAARKPVADLNAAIFRMTQLNPRLTPARARALAQAGSEPHPSGGIVWRFDPLHKTPSARPFNIEEYRHFWRGIRAPVLSLYGAASEWLSVGGIPERHALISTLRAGLVKDAGHNIHHDKPEVVTRAIERWLSGDRGQPVEGIVPIGRDLKPLGGLTW